MRTPARLADMLAGRYDMPLGRFVVATALLNGFTGEAGDHRFVEYGVKTVNLSGRDDLTTVLEDVTEKS